MPELRQDMATREWIVMATERARRPHDFRVKRSR
ncbi:MAG: Galactose-1-phosphate uridyl transferase, N-terminal domain, partial [candidate division NC10 bacterium]|nr:Galactose-1-phosphate uridyl transferase, N-terminal domain [candidate division NC10 bacterium]